jgi:hypothetical protein
VGAAVPDGARTVAALQRRVRRRHKKLTDWARQLLLQVHRWTPGREIVAVADSSFAAMELLAALSPA